MEKFSFFDFVSFLLPGGTLIIICYWLVKLQFPQFCPSALPETEILAIPFLVVAYMFGHLLSLIGKEIENLIP